MSVRKPADQRPDVDRAQAAAGHMSIPGDAAFNIISYQSGRSGKSGTARGDSEVHEDGASCRAEAGDGGSAWGAFQLGYCFDNAVGAVLHGTVKVRLTTSESSSRKRSGGDAAARPAPTKAERALTFFIKDTNGVVLRRETLLSGSLDEGPASSNATHDLVFDAKFQPDRGYYLILVGRTEVSAGASQSVDAALSVRDCSFEIRWGGVPTDGGPPDAGLSTAADSVPATDDDSL